ncbi:hypothetical protein GGR50DRAFT_634973 [Xylaria sp. CBS 124048]|nr:hypothetical protein GGR50DRAFT_634973 [Xylaria sp. CBS 124048]
MSALAQLKPFSLGPRTLFVKCLPAPQTFYERRAVFAALQRSSQQSIETFKRLQDSASFIVVASKPEIAKNLIANSPFDEVVVSKSSSDNDASIGAAWNVKSNDGSGAIANPVILLPSGSKVPESTPAYADLGLSHKAFTLHVFPANAEYDHRDEIKKNPLYAQWPGDERLDTYMSAALRRVIPSGALAPSLRDWEAGNRLIRDADSFADDGEEGAAAKLLGKSRTYSHKAFILERIRLRGTQQEIPKVMNSLFEFADRYRGKAVLPRANSDPSNQEETSMGLEGLIEFAKKYKSRFMPSKAQVDPSNKVHQVTFKEPNPSSSTSSTSSTSVGTSQPNDEFAFPKITTEARRGGKKRKGLEVFDENAFNRLFED